MWGRVWSGQRGYGWCASRARHAIAPKEDWVGGGMGGRRTGRPHRTAHTGAGTIALGWVIGKQGGHIGPPLQRFGGTTSTLVVRQQGSHRGLPLHVWVVGPGDG